MLSSILKRFGELLRHKRLHGLRLHQPFQFSALLSFLSGSPFVFIERYGMAPRDYGLIFGGMIVFMTIGSLLNAKFAPVFGAGKILRYAVIVPAIAGPTALVLGLIEARYGTIGMWPFLLCFAPQIATISLIGPNSMAMALQRYPHMAGTASSLMGVMQFGIGAIFGAVVGQTFDGTIAPMTTAMGVAGVLLLRCSNRLLVGPQLLERSPVRNNGNHTGGGGSGVALIAETRSRKHGCRYNGIIAGILLRGTRIPYLVIRSSGPRAPLVICVSRPLPMTAPTTRSDPHAAAAGPAGASVGLYAAHHRHVPAGAADDRQRSHGTAGDIQLTLSAFMIAFGFGQIFYGPAGDRFGRRPVILTGHHRLHRDHHRLRLRRRSGPARAAALPAGTGGMRRRGAGAHHGARPRREGAGGARHVADAWPAPRSRRCWRR